MGLTQITTGGVDDNINIDSNTLKVDGTNNRVGIGTASPSAPLDVETSNDIVIEARSTDRYAHIDLIDNAASSRFTTDGATGTLRLRADIGNAAASSAIQFEVDGSEKARIDSSGNVGIGTSAAALKLHVEDSGSQIIRFARTGIGAGSLDVDSNGNAVLNSHTTSASVVFHTQTTERMRIDSSGNVGIGTSSPSSFNSDGRNLVVGTGSGGQGMSIYSGASNYGTLYFADGTTGDALYRGGILYNHSSDFMRFDTAAGERMRIDSSGNVGIGTTSPSAKLDVSAAYNETALEVFSGGAGYSSPLIVGNASGSEYMRIDGSGFISQTFTSNNSSTPEGLFINNQNNATGNNASLIFSNDSGSRKKVAIAAVDVGSYGASDLVFALDGADSGSVNISSDEKMRIASNGVLRIGQTTSDDPSGSNIDGVAIGTNYISTAASNNLTAVFGRRSSTGTCVLFRYNTTNVGSITVGTSSTSYNESSDYRLKENVVNITDGITRVKQLKPSRFNFIADPDTTVDGFIAHEAQAVVPEAVTGTKDEVDNDGNAVMQGIDKSKLVPLLTAALQEAITKIETLEAKVAALEAG